ncbi:hypothetical protein ABPG72_018224 [Tetrahymena utriculariae]
MKVCCLLKIVTLFFLIFSSLACPTSCIQCNNLNTCQQCKQNFKLDQGSGICIFTGCQPYLYFQDKSNQQLGVCQAICDQGYQADDKTNLSININQCSLTYSAQTGISSVNEKIKQLLPYQDKYFMIVYSSYINIQLKSTGVFTQRIPFQQNIEYVEYFQGNFFIFQNDNKVAKWNFQNNSTALFNFASQGNLDSSTQIIQLNKQFTYAITFERKKIKNLRQFITRSNCTKLCLILFSYLIRSIKQLRVLFLLRFNLYFIIQSGFQHSNFLQTKIII